MNSKLFFPLFIGSLIFYGFCRLVQLIEYINNKNKYIKCIEKLKLCKMGNLISIDYCKKLKNSKGETGLIIASKHNEIDIVKKMVKNGYDINSRDDSGRTSLHYAVNNKDIAKYLIANGADTNIYDNGGKIPLMYFIDKYRFSKHTINHLINKDTKINKKSTFGSTLLHYIIEHKSINSLKNFKLLIKKGADINIKDYEGLDALSIAINLRHIVIVEHILKFMEPNFNSQDCEGYTPLMSAIIMGKKYDKILLLTVLGNTDWSINYEQYREYKKSLNLAIKKSKAKLTKKIDINIVNEDGDDALMLAIRHKRNIIANILIKLVKNLYHTNKNNETYLICAIENKNITCFNKLIEYGYNINHVSEYSPLILAVDIENKKIVKRLLELKYKLIDNQSIYNNNNTALMIAIKRKNLKLFKMLLKSGANIHIKNKDGNDALLYIIKLTNRLDMFDILLQYKPNLNTRNKEGNNVLLEAVKIGYLYPIKKLLLNNINVDVHNKNKMTPIMYAFNNGYREITNLLMHRILYCGKILPNYLFCNINKQSCTGETVLHYIAKKKKFSHAVKLIRYGANTSIKDKNNNTVWNMMSKYCKKYIVNEIKNYSLVFLCIRKIRGNNLYSKKILQTYLNRDIRKHFGIKNL